jgi:hypothetical protein
MNNIREKQRNDIVIMLSEIVKDIHSNCNSYEYDLDDYSPINTYDKIVVMLLTTLAGSSKIFFNYTQTNEYCVRWKRHK